MKKLLLTTVWILAAMPAHAETTLHHAMHQHPPASQDMAGGIAATGHVVRVNAERHIITLKHDPIDALGWPTMTMKFNADSRVDLSQINEGDAVSFILQPSAEDDYRIVSLTKSH